MRRLCAIAAATLIVAPAAGAQTIRIAVRTLDDPSIARSLFPTAAELCPRPMQVAPRRWRLTCRHARAVAEALGGSASGRVVTVGTGWEWGRFPLRLRAVVVNGVRRFRTVNAGPKRIAAGRPGLTLEFVRMEPHAAAQAFRRGEIDAAPVALGDIKAALADSVVGPRVHVRPIRAVDVVRLDLRRGALAGLPNTRRAFWESADRLDYQALVPEGAAARAYGLLATARPARAPLLREFRRRAAALPPVTVPLGVGRDPDLRYGATLLAAQWREVGLAASVLRSAPDRFERLRALYDAPEALFLALQPNPSPLLRRALAADDPMPFLRLLDTRLRNDAAVIPVSWVASAWLVSPRLRGWRQDALGAVDYTRFAGQ